MATQEPPSIAERIFNQLADKLVEWVGEQDPFTVTLVFALVWATWKMRQLCKERPEWHFLIDLLIDTLLAVAFSQSIRVFTDEIPVHGAEGEGFASTAIGHWVIMGMEALQFLPFLLLFAFQALKLCQVLRQKW